MKNRLKEWREKRGYTQEEFGELVGKSRNTILRIENGKLAFTDKNKVKFAEALDCKPEDFLYIDTVTPTGHIPVTVMGYVQAGFFGEANELSVRDEDVMYVSPKYPDAHCLIVKGDSMNERFKDGTKLICIPFYGQPSDITPGKAVIVEAIREDDKSEYTVKEFYVDDKGTYWLLPRSTNPVYQNYPVPNGEDINVTINGYRIKDILIKALVVSSQYDED